MPPLLLVLADDLIWASRLRSAAERAGAEAVSLRDVGGLDAALGRRPEPAGAIVDLGGRTYDGVAAVERIAGAGRPVLAVAQHDDLALRKRALAAGADRVLSYNKMHADGPAVISAWLARHVPAGPRSAVGDR